MSEEQIKEITDAMLNGKAMLIVVKTNDGKGLTALMGDPNEFKMILAKTISHFNMNDYLKSVIRISESIKVWDVKS